MTFTFDHIRDSGFEASLEQLIAYTEMQAKLHQSLNDRDQQLFWARAWAQLQWASDAMAEGRLRPSHSQNDQECLEMWQEHCSEYASADIDFGFRQ